MQTQQRLFTLVILLLQGIDFAEERLNELQVEFCFTEAEKYVTCQQEGASGVMWTVLRWEGAIGGGSIICTYDGVYSDYRA